MTTNDASADVPSEIVCVDCGGICHLLSYAPEDGWSVGDVVAYRCEDCRDRWDLVVGEPDDGHGDEPSAPDPAW